MATIRLRTRLGLVLLRLACRWADHPMEDGRCGCGERYEGFGSPYMPKSYRGWR